MKNRRRKWLITITVMSGAILASLDISIVNVALPYMRGALGASVEEIAWVSIGYILSTVITMPIVALLSSRFGRKRYYLFSVLLFTVASTLCGLTWDLVSMVTLRVIQGIGGGALIPIALAILQETFPPEEQPMAMGIYGLGVMLGPAVGPTLGGWLTDQYSWTWIFYIKWPLGLVTALLILRYIEDPVYLIRDKGKIDFPGIALLTVGLGALQIMLERGTAGLVCIGHDSAARLDFRIDPFPFHPPGAENRQSCSRSQDPEKRQSRLCMHFSGRDRSCSHGKSFSDPHFPAVSAALPGNGFWARHSPQKPRHDSGLAGSGKDIQQDGTEMAYRDRFSYPDLLFLPVLDPFAERRVLGSLLSPAHAGIRVRDHFRCTEHGGPVLP